METESETSSEESKPLFQIATDRLLMSWRPLKSSKEEILERIKALDFQKQAAPRVIVREKVYTDLDRPSYTALVLTDRRKLWYGETLDKIGGVHGQYRSLEPEEKVDYARMTETGEWIAWPESFEREVICALPRKEEEEQKPLGENHRKRKKRTFLKPKKPSKKRVSSLTKGTHHRK